MTLYICYSGFRITMHYLLYYYLCFQDFTLEQDSVTPANGWKSYYAATRAILGINAEFFNIIRERQLPGMGQLWFNADYVKCIHASGELFSGYGVFLSGSECTILWLEELIC